MLITHRRPEVWSWSPRSPSPLGPRRRRAVGTAEAARGRRTGRGRAGPGGRPGGGAPPRHRWLALVVGTVLLVELVTGTILLFRPEIVRAGQPAALRRDTERAAPRRGRRPGGRRARATRPRHRGHRAGRRRLAGRTTDYHHAVYVDPGSGRILGEADPTGGFLGLVLNVHDCLLACEGYTGYVPALAATVPGLRRADLGEPRARRRRAGVRGAGGERRDRVVADDAPVRPRPAAQPHRPRAPRAVPVPPRPPRRRPRWSPCRCSWSGR